MDEEKEWELNIRRYSKDFSARLSQFNFNTQLYVVFGGSRCGKSITVDLLAGKELVIRQDQILYTKVLVQTLNEEQNYPPIHIINNKNTMIMQSFTLDENSTNDSIQVLKLIYLESFIEHASKVSFILSFDEVTIQSIQQLLDHYLNCMGISSSTKDDYIEIIKEYVYIFVTKTEPEAFEQVLEKLEQIRHEIQHQNAQIMLNYMIQKQRIIEFPMQQPSKDFADIVKSKFAVRKNCKQLHQMLKNSKIRSSIQTQELIQDRIQMQILELYSKIIKMIINLALYSNSKDRKFQIKYENITNQIFNNEEKEMSINSMIGNWNLKQLKDLNLNIPRNVTSKERIVKIKDLLIQILVSMQNRALMIKQKYSQIKYMLYFFIKLTDWVKHQLLEQKNEEIIKQMQQLIKQIKLVNMRQNSPKIRKPSPQKKPTPFSTFKEQMIVCSTNEDAIFICLSKIKQKEQNQKYDFFEIIYYIKLLRDILAQLNTIEPGILINELLEISLYSQDFYDFNTYLHQCTKYLCLSQNNAIIFIKRLLQYQKYEQCQTIIKYAIGLASNQQNYDHLSKLKYIVKKKNHEKFHNINQNHEKQPPRRVHLSFTSKDLEQKWKDEKRIKQMLQSSTFKKYLNLHE